MLKLVGSLRNGSSRLSSRCGARRMPNHQLTASCNGAASAAPQQDIETPPVSQNGPKQSVENPPRLKSSMVKEAFTDLDIRKTNPQQDVHQLSVKGKEVKTEELLSMIDNKFISYKQALQIITILSQQVEKGKINLKYLESDVRYKKFCKIVAKRATIPPTSDSVSGIKIAPSNSNEWDATKSTGKYVEKSIYPLNGLHDVDNMKNLSLSQSIQILRGFAVRQMRPKPILQGLAGTIGESANCLTIKNIADILYSMAKLNFIDESLLTKLSQELQQKLEPVNQSPIIGSILTSVGMMRYKDAGLMNALCDWTIKHKKVLRTQDLCALLMTLAVVGYTPSNFQVLYKDVIINLKETDMTTVSEWVDVVWSLIVLNQATHQHIQSTLNDKFISKLTDQADIPVAKKHKLLNINAAAKYLLKDYSGPLLKDDSLVMDVPISRIKDKEIFVKSITDALANLFPSREHFQSNVDRKTGFLIDVEFFIDTKFTALPVSKLTADTKAFRIAIIANYYHDFCVGQKSLVGSVLLHNRLLEAMDYRLLDISYSDFHTDDKLLKRISYLNDRIKAIVK